MTALEWNKVGERYFEAGVDRGVLYVGEKQGVAWNGLIAVKDVPSGGEPKAYYQEGRKYLNRSAREEYAGGIEAYTYPDEFAECDGTITTPYGFSVHQQGRKEFGLSYRTRIGNDTQGTQHGYKIHLIYRALAAPSDRTATSISDTVDPSNFSWDFTTTPVDLDGYLPISHVSIDSRGLRPATLRYIESVLYGGMNSSAFLPAPSDLIDLFNKETAFWQIVPDPITGLNTLVQGYFEDLTGSSDSGYFKTTDSTRLQPTSKPGYSTFQA